MAADLTRLFRSRADRDRIDERIAGGRLDVLTAREHIDKARKGP